MAQSADHPPPVLTTTPSEVVHSLLLALVGFAALGTLFGGVAWMSLRKPPRPPAVAVEIIDDPGGSETGAVDETLQVTADAPESVDATPAEIESDETEIDETLDNVLELADEAVNQSQKQFELGLENRGRRGSAKGTGRRGLGKGKGAGGIPREERWYIRYSDRQTLEEYARQLDFFRIELGVLGGGKMTYVGRFSTPQPAIRVATTGGDERRLYMTWQGGGRRVADLELLRKAGVEPGQGVLFQFFPNDVEQQLSRLEVEYGARKPEQIRRTYFAIRPATQGTGYEFYVSRQTLR